jgi:hypothetical protein
MKLVVLLIYGLIKIISLLKSKQYSLDPQTLNIERNLYNINGGSSETFAHDYLFENMYITEGEKKENKKEEVGKEGCSMNKKVFIDYLNTIRDKHMVQRIKWLDELSNEAKRYTDRLESSNNCTYTHYEYTDLTQIFFEGPERLSERDLINKWYEPFYYLNTNSTKKKQINYFNTGMILNEAVSEIGCYKICCPYGEIYLCLFRPKFPNEEDIFDHIKPNKYIR